MEEVIFHNQVAEELLQFAVIIAKTEGKWVFERLGFLAAFSNYDVMKYSTTGSMTSNTSFDKIIHDTEIPSGMIINERRISWLQYWWILKM